MVCGTITVLAVPVAFLGGSPWRSSTLPRPAARVQLHGAVLQRSLEALHLIQTYGSAIGSIKACIARGYTQAELAKRLRLKPQQLQRYEATRYHSVSFRRLLEIARALDVDLSEMVRLARQARRGVDALCWRDVIGLRPAYVQPPGASRYAALCLTRAERQGCRAALSMQEAPWGA